MKGNRSGKGYFNAMGDEPLSRQQIGTKLPLSLEKEVRQVAGDNLSAWIREAIIEKLEREQQISA